MSYKLKITRGTERSTLLCYSPAEAQKFIGRVEAEHEARCLRAVAKARASRKGAQTAAAHAPARPSFKLLKVPSSR
jgi:hypothetical protein